MYLCLQKITFTEHLLMPGSEHNERYMELTNMA